MFHHPELNRHEAVALLADWERPIEVGAEITPVRPNMGAAQAGGITHSERTFGQWLIECGFPVLSQTLRSPCRN